MNDRDVIRYIREISGASGEPDRLSRGEFDDVVAATGQLSEALNHERSIVSSAYLDDTTHLLGYVGLFLPRSVAQFGSLIPELGARPRRVVDLGCGPGPGTIAALEAGAEAILAVDHSSNALQLVERLTDDRVETRLADLESVRPGELVSRFGADTVVTGHLVNELWAGHDDATRRRADFVASVLDVLEPGGRLLMLDPALRETSRALIEVRDLLVERGYPVFAPCLRQANCPALEDVRDWCHAERAWTPPPVVSQLAEAVGVRDDVFKMTYFVFGPRSDQDATKQPACDLRNFRIVSEPLHTKGRLRYYGCGVEGRIPLVMKERDAVDAASDFATLTRGDVVGIGETVEKGDGHVVRKGEPARRIVRAGEPVIGTHLDEESDER